MELSENTSREKTRERQLSDARASLDRALIACVASAAATVEPGGLSSPLYPTDDARIRLRDCVRDYTEAMRSMGELPEQALKRVKEITAEIAPGVEPYSALASDVSRWCIEAYFEARKSE